MNEQARNDRSRRQLVLIVVVALASLGGAWLLYYLTVGDRPWGTTNQGTFVEPPRTAGEFALTTSAGEAFDTDGKWWLWIVPREPCAADCEFALHQLRQLHVLLHKDSERVRRALLIDSGAEKPAIAEHYPRLEVLSGNLAGLAAGIYVVDPIGNVILHYPLEDAGDPVLDDLERLLEVSQIWGSFSFDDEGAPARRTVLFEDGVLRGWLYDRLRAEKDGVPSSGNGRRQSYSNSQQRRLA